MASPSWVERDAAVVWHGFTQMATYTDNAPIIVERAEGRELIDVDGRRYLDAISSLWVTTLGHRVPELDAAIRDQLGNVAHSTLLGNGNRAVIELAEALAVVVPVDGPHFLLVADAALGTINAVRLSLAALAEHRVVVALNRYDRADDLQRRNRAWLAGECEVAGDVADVVSRLEGLR
jgi:adenosylmethionine-8-amino-7-oxononanoate aminotransferase